jgi:hypothetical protein
VCVCVCECVYVAACAVEVVSVCVLFSCVCLMKSVLSVVWVTVACCSLFVSYIYIELLELIHYGVRAGKRRFYTWVLLDHEVCVQ